MNVHKRFSFDLEGQQLLKQCFEQQAIVLHGMLEQQIHPHCLGVHLLQHGLHVLHGCLQHTFGDILRLDFALRDAVLLGLENGLPQQLQQGLQSMQPQGLKHGSGVFLIGFLHILYPQEL